MSSLQIIQDEVDALFLFRDSFFESNPAAVFQKAEIINQKMLAVIRNIELKADILDPGQILYLKGRALNVGQNYNAEAEPLLSKATKFNIPEAWNELGECLYKKGELGSAKTCFEKTLLIEDKKPVYYRNLSMLMRSLPSDNAKEKEGNIHKGLEYAKSALDLDYNDGHSWLVLGNSYLTLFFTFSTNQETLKKCKSAYSKAESDPKSAKLPELYFNKSQIEWYEEEYGTALRSLKTACSLDPTWTEPKVKLDQSVKFLKNLSHLCHFKGGLTDKKFDKLIAGIKPVHLGPYRDGGTKLTNHVQPLISPLRLLAEGVNENTVVSGCVIGTVVPDSGVPFAFVMADSDRECRAVTVYNWSDSASLKIGDYVSIVSPHLKRHVVDSDEIAEFHSLRVIFPPMLVVNKKCVTPNQMGTSSVVSNKF